MFEIEDRHLRMRAGTWQRLAYELADTCKSMETATASSFVDDEDKNVFERCGVYLKSAYFIAAERARIVGEEYIRAQKEQVDKVVERLQKEQQEAQATEED